VWFIFLCFIKVHIEIRVTCSLNMICKRFVESVLWRVFSRKKWQFTTQICAMSSVNYVPRRKCSQNVLKGRFESRDSAAENKNQSQKNLGNMMFLDEIVRKNENQTEEARETASSRTTRFCFHYLEHWDVKVTAQKIGTNKIFKSTTCLHS
jgi:hypothetical protein